MEDMSKDGLILGFDMDTENWNKKYFVTFIDDASRFCYVYLLHTKDEALDKFKVFKTKFELQQGSLIKRFWTDRGVVRLPDPKLKTLGKRGIECVFVGYADHSKAFRDEVSDQHSYCFNVKGDPKTFDKSIKSQDVIFWKEAINDEMDSIMGNNTWVLVDLPSDDMKTTFFNGKLGEEVDLTKEFSSSSFSMKDVGEADVILVSTSMDTSEKSMTNNVEAASKKQTYITGSTIESEFMALAAAGKEAEWVKNLLLKIPLWYKPIAPICIRYDSAATLAKAYSQM
nr:zinc finger, CCHC-type [Tanacetum cinerariifolium]